MSAIDPSNGEEPSSHCASSPHVVVAIIMQTPNTTPQVTRSAHVALRFTGNGDDVMIQMFLDDNRNGVRMLDIASQVDRALDVPTRLSEMFPGVVIGISTELGTDPVRIGSTNLLAFTPLGTATPGTVYVRGRDGLQLAVPSPDRRAGLDFCATFLAHASRSHLSDALWAGSTFQSRGECHYGG